MEKLKSEILSVDWQIAKAASEELARIGGKEVTDFLISLLESGVPSVRNVAALGLRDIGNSEAVEPLFKAIYNMQNENNRGTLVYALQTLDCSHNLVELFDLLFYGNYEVKMGVSTILDEQEFEFTNENIEVIQSKWQELLKHPEKYPDCTDDCKEYIKEYVEDLEFHLDKI